MQHRVDQLDLLKGNHNIERALFDSKNKNLCNYSVVSSFDFKICIGYISIVAGSQFQKRYAN
jgi:hypothetical protein